MSMEGVKGGILQMEAEESKTHCGAINRLAHHMSSLPSTHRPQKTCKLLLQSRIIHLMLMADTLDICISGFGRTALAPLVTFVSVVYSRNKQASGWPFKLGARL